MTQTKLERGPMVGRMLEGDFEKDTITFHMPATYYLANGRYIIEPEADWVRRKEQLTALSSRASAGEGGDELGAAELRSQEQRAMGWDAICNLLFELRPKWTYGAGTGIELAVATIRAALTAAPQPAQADEVEGADMREFERRNAAFVNALPRKIDGSNSQPAQAGASGGGGITAKWVVGYMMAPIRNPEAWPENYANGFNDCAKTCAEQVLHAFGEWEALHPTQPQQESAQERPFIDMHNGGPIPPPAHGDGELPELPRALLEVLSDLDVESVAYNQAVSLIYHYARQAREVAK